MGLGALTVAEIEQLEESRDRPLDAFDRPSDWAALLLAIYGEQKAAETRWADRAAALIEAMPEGRAAYYLAVFGAPPWCWPPEVTRRQQVRDLDLILISMPEQ